MGPTLDPPVPGQVRPGSSNSLHSPAGVSPRECVYVDDLPFNLTPAEKLGMATVHHTSAEQSIPALERLRGLARREPRARRQPRLARLASRARRAA